MGRKTRLGKLCVAEGVDFDLDALSFIATKSKGSLRDAEMMLDQLSLVGKKITVSLVYEVIGVVSDDELIDLLHLALSFDASNTVKRARELMRSRIDPLQLTSQLANLIMDILAGKCPEGISEGRRKLFGSHSSEADIQQLSHALKILSETEKRLHSSKNQTTWLTAALLQMSSLKSSPDANESRLSIRTLNPQDAGADFCSTSTNSDSLNYLVTCSCDNIASRKIGMPDGEETLELMWKRATGMCQSNSLKKFLRKQGKLMSICLNQKGLAVAGLEFHHRDHVHKAERSWKLITTALQCVLGCNVELRINLARNASGKKGKFKKPCLSLFGCSRNRRSQLSSECGKDTSENFDFIPKIGITRDKSVETCSPDCGSQLSEACCHGEKVVKTIRSQDGNALSIGVSKPHRSFIDNMGRTNQLGFNSSKDGSKYECLDLIALEHENQTGCVSSIQNLNMSNASRTIHSSNQQQCNLALSFPCKTSSETNFSSSNISASRVSTLYCNSYKDNNISRGNSKLRCWRTAMFPFQKAWKSTRQSRGEHMVDCALPCPAAAK